LSWIDKDLLAEADSLDLTAETGRIIRRGQEAAQAAADTGAGLLGRLTSMWDDSPTPTDEAAALTRVQPSSGTPAAMPTAPVQQPRRLTSGLDFQPSDASGQIGTVEGRAARFAPQIAKVSRETGVPQDVLAGLIDTEDSGEDSVSAAGARGIGQVVPGQGYDLPGEDASDPETSIRQMARAALDKNRMVGGDWDETGAAYFGYGGSDATGMTTDGYRQRYIANRRKYQGVGGDWQQATVTPNPQRSAANPQSSAPSSSYTQQGLADAGDPDAWAKCGPVAAFQFAQKMGRNPTPAEAEELARQVGWTGQKGMAGFQSEAALLAKMNIAAKVESGVDWDKVITDVSRGNPVLLELPGHEGHYITAQGYDPQTGKIDFGSTVGDLAAAKHQTQFTPSELEGLGGASRARRTSTTPQARPHRPWRPVRSRKRRTRPTGHLEPGRACEGASSVTGANRTLRWRWRPAESAAHGPPDGGVGRTGADRGAAVRQSGRGPGRARGDAGQCGREPGPRADAGDRRGAGAADKPAAGGRGACDSAAFLQLRAGSGAEPDLALASLARRRAPAVEPLLRGAPHVDR
jgi:hypothetical protein